MSVLQNPTLQIWDNAAFDDAGNIPTGKSPLQPLSTNPPQSPDLDPIKENRNPAINKPLDIDAEIEAIEKEIGQLSKRLDVLRIKKAERDSKNSVIAPRGRIVPAKFMNLDRKIQESPANARINWRGISLGPVEIYDSATPLRSVAANSRRKSSCLQKLEDIKEEKHSSRRRGMSLGPSEIATASQLRQQQRSKIQGIKESGTSTRINRRGLSLGPLEIYSNATPLKSCHRKLDDIKEEKDLLRRTAAASQLRQQRSKIQETKEKGVKGSKGHRSLSPKPRRPVSSKVSELRKGVWTVGAKRAVKTEEGPMSSIKPRALFQEDKKPSKNQKVRVVASRYGLTNSCEPGSKRRKWSLPESKDESNVLERNRALSLGGANASGLKEDKFTPSSIMKIAELLPKVRIKCESFESPRDSGCAKRVAELVGRKSVFFGAPEGEEEDLKKFEGQSLNFEDEEQ